KRHGLDEGTEKTIKWLERFLTRRNQKRTPFFDPVITRENIKELGRSVSSPVYDQGDFKERHFKNRTIEFPFPEMVYSKNGSSSVKQRAKRFRNSVSSADSKLLVGDWQRVVSFPSVMPGNLKKNEIDTLLDLLRELKRNNDSHKADKQQALMAVLAIIIESGVVTDYYVVRRIQGFVDDLAGKEILLLQINSIIEEVTTILRREKLSGAAILPDKNKGGSSPAILKIREEFRSWRFIGVHTAELVKWWEQCSEHDVRENKKVVRQLMSLFPYRLGVGEGRFFSQGKSIMREEEGWILSDVFAKHTKFFAGTDFAVFGYNLWRCLPNTVASLAVYKYRNGQLARFHILLPFSGSEVESSDISDVREMYELIFSQEQYYDISLLDWMLDNASKMPSAVWISKSITGYGKLKNFIGKNITGKPIEIYFWGSRKHGRRGQLIFLRDYLCAEGQTISSAVGIENMVKQVSKERLKQFITLLPPGETGSEGYRKTARLIYQYFKKLGLHTRYHHYLYNGSAYVNVVGVLEGDNKETVYLTAHFDTEKGSCGANDNRSGTSLMLEIAKILSRCKFYHTVKFVAFSGEEIGKAGSKAFARTVNKKMAKGVVNIDCVGRFMRVFRQDIVADSQSLGFAKEFVTKLNLISQKRKLSIFLHTLDHDSDHTSFWDVGIPAILIWSSTCFGHSEYDTFERIDLEHLEWMTQVILIGVIGVTQNAVSGSSSLMGKEHGFLAAEALYLDGEEFRWVKQTIGEEAVDYVCQVWMDKGGNDQRLLKNMFYAFSLSKEGFRRAVESGVS
ncbi:MAG: M28 family peptidase, partial [Candidatus Omnitrophota bacterium]